MQIEAYIRATGPSGAIVDSFNARSSGILSFVLGMAADLHLHIFNGEAESPMSATDFDNLSTWRLSIDKDYDQTTQVLLRLTSGISVNESDGAIDIHIDNFCTAALVTALGKAKSTSFIAEIAGYAAGETIPTFLLQFPVTVMNRVDLEGGDESVPVAANYYTNSQVDALLSATYEFQFSDDGSSWHSTQATDDIYFRIRNSAVDNAAWSGAITIPKGADGADGQDGTAATITIGTVTTGSIAGVINSGTATEAVLNFIIPVGAINDAPQDGKFYVRCNGQWVELPANSGGSGNSGEPEIPGEETAYAYYGIISDGTTYAVSQVTAAMAKTLTKAAASQIVNPITLASVPAGALLFIAVPSGYTAEKDDGLGGRAAFEANNGLAGTGDNGTGTIEIDGVTYATYGEFRLSSADALVYIEEN